jgi:oxygen-independent coproporphyrinogen-3 oxidase
VELVRSHGYEHCSVDLIYGTPGESIDDWRESVAAALSLKVDHLSAYALIVEKGTKLAARVKSGELIIPPEDETATKYEIVDEMCGEKGFHWYELSNWSAEGGECRHNISYWDGSHWWGVGPGAHSYFNGVRWWNVKHPETYQSKIKEGKSPMLESEELSEQNRRDESIMLRIRMREGIPLSDLSPAERERVGQYLESNHLDDGAWTQGKLVLTRSGRLIADRIVREILV